MVLSFLFKFDNNYTEVAVFNGHEHNFHKGDSYNVN